MPIPLVQHNFRTLGGSRGAGQRHMVQVQYDCYIVRVFTAPRSRLVIICKDTWLRPTSSLPAAPHK